jgi:hypothetical protein
MTFANAIARVRYLLHEPVAKMWSDAEIGIWLNDGQRAMCVRRGIEEIWTDELTAESSAVVTSDLLSIYKVVLEGETLKRYAYKIFHNTIFFVEDYTDTAKVQTGTLEVYGTRAPVDAATTPVAVDFEIPDTFMDGPIYYAMEMANMKDEQYPEAQIYVQLFAVAQRAWETSRKYATTSMTSQWI